MTAVNAFGQPIGDPVPEWSAPPRPPRASAEGRYVSIEPIHERFASDLHDANAGDADGRSWTYLPYGPFADAQAYRRWMQTTCFGDDPLFHAIVERASGRAVGVAAFMRIAPEPGTIEVGHVHFSPRLQRTRGATEAMALMMRRAFELGYRRYEWKRDALNAASRAAAQRLGFSFEGVFRQATVYKGRSRDTAWYAAIDKDWPALSRAFDAWLSPGNFDESGRQRVRLGDLTGSLLAARG